MLKARLWAVSIIAALALSACATLPKGASSPNADQVAQTFFSDLQRPDRPAAYGLFAQGLSQQITFERFEALMNAMESKWGRISNAEAVELPFHKRPGERDFIPLGVKEDDIKRYVFEVKFNSAEMDCALTIVPQDGQNKIVWISFWGSGIYLTPDIKEKLGQLFSRAALEPAVETPDPNQVP